MDSDTSRTSEPRSPEPRTPEPNPDTHVTVRISKRGYDVMNTLCEYAEEVGREHFSRQFRARITVLEGQVSDLQKQTDELTKQRDFQEQTVARLRTERDRYFTALTAMSTISRDATRPLLASIGESRQQYPTPPQPRDPYRAPSTKR